MYIELVPDAPGRVSYERRIENLARLQEERRAERDSEDPSTEPAAADAAGSAGAAREDHDADSSGVTLETSESSDDGDGLLIGGIVGIAVGGVGLAMMATFGALALSEDSSLASGCGAAGTCSDDEVANANTFALLADIGLGVGLAGVSVGATLLILSLSRDDDDPAAPATAVSPWFTPDGAGASAHVQF